MSIHGGDIYRNKVNIDFSVSISPYGIPPAVRAEVADASLDITAYPDPVYKELKASIGKSESVSDEFIVCGNGASELIYASCRAVSDTVATKGEVSLLTPCFLGYEKAALAAGFEKIKKVCLIEEKGFISDEEQIQKLTENSSLIIIGNPNNPTGRLLDENWLNSLICASEKNGSYVIIDETFLPLTEKEYKYEIHSDRVIRIRAYTKSMSIPGVRLGYLICKNKMMINTIKGLLPEWNVSLIAQRAGVKCAEQKEWLKEKINDSENGLRSLREKVFNELNNLGFKVYNSDTNFLLIKSDINLYELLLKKGILIRDCSNFDGLEKGYYRIAIKSESENRYLTDEIKNIYEKINNENEAVHNGNEDCSGKQFKKEHILLSVIPAEIEKTSFDILTEELKSKGIELTSDTASVIKRCIHTTADFQYATTLTFSDDAVNVLKNLIRNGACIVTDTNMALSGINKNELSKYGSEAYCFMADPEIAIIAKERGCTRATASMEHASTLSKNTIFVIGNAPTALVTLCEMMDRGDYIPSFVIGVPVGFVNVEQAKEMIIDRDLNYIVNRGRKGGSNVAAAIVNAVLYSMRDE